MKRELPATADSVGPVLRRGPTTEAVISAIKALNRDVVLLDRGAYVRVLVPHRCVLTRAEIEAHLGRPFRMLSELEAVMSAFKGRFHVDDEMAVWEFHSRTVVP